MKRFLTHLRFLNWKLARRMAKNWLAVRILRQRRLRNAQLALTYRCNHACTFCSSNELLDWDRRELTMQEWMKTADQLYALGCTHFDLTGGEPTLWGLHNLCTLIRYITRWHDCLVSLATNGKLVSPGWLLTLREAGLNSILFDIQPGDHDELVKDAGNRRRIEELIVEAKRLGLNVCINTCLGLHNWHEFEDLLKWATARDLHVLTNLAAPTGRLSEQQVRMTDLREFYYTMMDRYPLMRSDTTYNYFASNRCPGGREKVYITCYGDVIQCTFIQISYGNVLEQPLKEIYDRMWENWMIRKKFICKHTFWPEFQRWADGEMKRGKLPVNYVG